MRIKTVLQPESHLLSVENFDVSAAHVFFVHFHGLFQLDLIIKLDKRFTRWSPVLQISEVNALLAIFDLAHGEERLQFRLAGGEGNASHPHDEVSYFTIHLGWVTYINKVYVQNIVYVQNPNLSLIIENLHMNSFEK